MVPDTNRGQQPAAQQPRNGRVGGTKRAREAEEEPKAGGLAGGKGKDVKDASHNAPQAQTPRFKPLPPQPGVKGPVDVFGQSHPAKATDVVTCKNCNRQVCAGTFAPHLEKCMGKGRAAARAATRRMQGQQ